jgi:hypothetical protein
MPMEWMNEHNSFKLHIKFSSYPKHNKLCLQHEVLKNKKYILREYDEILDFRCLSRWHMQLPLTFKRLILSDVTYSLSSADTSKTDRQTEPNKKLCLKCPYETHFLVSTVHINKDKLFKACMTLHCKLCWLLHSACLFSSLASIYHGEKMPCGL